jgi:hypothetical protein
MGVGLVITFLPEMKGCLGVLGTLARVSSGEEGRPGPECTKLNVPVAQGSGCAMVSRSRSGISPLTRVRSRSSPLP